MIYTIFHNRYALYNKLPRINKKKIAGSDQNDYFSDQIIKLVYEYWFTISKTLGTNFQSNFQMFITQYRWKLLTLQITKKNVLIEEITKKVCLSVVNSSSELCSCSLWIMYNILQYPRK